MKLAPDAPSAHADRRHAVERICVTLVEMQAELDALDAKVGDGDTGTTFATGARAILSDLDRLPFADAPALCASIADRLSRVMGGSSGILLAIFFSAMSAALSTTTTTTTSTASAATWHAALRDGARRVQLYGGAKLGDRTMLDALLPAIDALALDKGFAAAAEAARRGADATATMTKANAGRSSYVRADALRGVADPGAIAVARVFEALAAVGAAAPR